MPAFGFQRKGVGLRRNFAHSVVDQCPATDLAGEEGFEPSHAGIKIQCLNQLGDSPTVTPKKSNCKRDFYLAPEQFDLPILLEDFAKDLLVLRYLFQPLKL